MVGGEGKRDGEGGMEYVYGIGCIAMDWVELNWMYGIALHALCGIELN